MDVGAANATDTNLVVDPVGSRCQKLFQDFLEEWQDGEELKYLKAAQELLKPERNTMVVSMRDVERYNPGLAQSIQDEYYRLYPYLCAALKNYVTDRADTDVKKEYFIAFSDVDASLKVRDLTSGRIGTLVKITGQVVRTHPVHPELVLGTFICADCQTSIPDVEQQFKYTQPSICRNPVCNNRQRFSLDVSKSRFVDFQKVRVQEIQSELPRGSIPRSLEIILRAEAVETAQPGDRCDFVGTLIVVPDVGSIQLPGARAESASRGRGNETEGVQGLKSLGVRDLHHKMAFLACNVLSGTMRIGDEAADNNEEASPATIKERMSPAEWNTIYKMSQDRNLYTNLINSLFPTIHGNDEVKRGILLMLFGGVGKTTHDMTKLRGDVNICVVGDPSTAKSQLLKQVADFSPRAVYTSGKASSAAGLTAAVVKDEESAEFVIEAGALMLADNGVCCIDEFDKMDPKDQVAIHEAMEQQTISITKAGVKATLNARTSILAAANPIGGRYDRTKSLKQNIMMTAPIMSRFDLFFILVDDCNEVTDYAIARRIIDLHMRAEESVERTYEPADIARYISFARLFKPKVTEESMEHLVDQYKHLRQRDTGGGFKSSWRITVRQLESMIRLSEAMARMACNDKVELKHVQEAYRLLNKSIIRVDQPDIHFEDEDAIAADLDNEMEVDDPGHNVASPGGEVNGLISSQKSQAAKSKKLTLSQQEYFQMANVIVHYLRQKEDLNEDVHRNDIVNWYIEHVMEEVESQDELVEKKQIVEKVLDRLAYNDNVLVPLNKTGLQTGATESGDSDANPVLIVHPNYVEDE